MKKGKYFMLTSILVMFALLGFGLAYNSGFNFKGLDLLVFSAITIVGGVALYAAQKKDKAIAKGYTVEDELSLLIKYKAGYTSFLFSLFIWLFVFIFKDEFPNQELMFSGGLLLSIGVFFITRLVLKNRINEK